MMSSEVINNGAKRHSGFFGYVLLVLVWNPYRAIRCFEDMRTQNHRARGPLLANCALLASSDLFYSC